MKLRLIAVMTALLAMTSVANAGLVLDPYFGTGTYKATQSGNTDLDKTATSLGARVGMSIPMFAVGIDYEKQSASDKNNIKHTNLSVFAMANLPLVRVWGEYFLSSSWDSDLDTSAISFKDGIGFGAGFTGLPFVSLNLEMQTLNYEYKGASDIKVVTTVFSVSLPLDL